MPVALGFGGSARAGRCSRSPVLLLRRRYTVGCVAGAQLSLRGAQAAVQVVYLSQFLGLPASEHRDAAVGDTQ